MLIHVQKDFSFLLAIIFATGNVSGGEWEQSGAMLPGASLCSLSLRDKAPSHERADTTPGGFSFCFICTNLTAALFCSLSANGDAARLTVYVLYVCLCMTGTPVFVALHSSRPSTFFDPLIVNLCHEQNHKFDETFPAACSPHFLRLHSLRCLL